MVGRHFSEWNDFFVRNGHSHEILRFQVEDVLGRHKEFSVWGDFFAGGGEPSQVQAQLNTLKLDQNELDEILAVKEAMAAGDLCAHLRACAGVCGCLYRCMSSCVMCVGCRRVVCVLAGVHASVCACLFHMRVGEIFSLH